MRVPVGRRCGERAMHWRPWRPLVLHWRLQLAIASLVHHNRPNLGRCDLERTCRLHLLINVHQGWNVHHPIAPRPLVTSTAVL